MLVGLWMGKPQAVLSLALGEQEAAGKRPV